MSYNKSLELSLRDLELISQALEHKANRLETQRTTHIESTIKPVQELYRVKEIELELEEINQLQWRLDVIKSQ